MTQSRKLVQGRESPNETASVSRACDILNLLVQQNAALRLTDVARLTGINKATVYRILSTLSNHKLVSKTASNEYVSVLNKRVPSGIRIGYASQTDEFAFSRAVTAGIVASSREAGIELFMLDNSYSPTAALQNADALIKEGVQLVIEFQTDASVAALISTKLNERHIPLIAIEIPHPNAVYFGVNNIQAGLAGGRHLARWSIDNWSGQVDQLLLVGLAKAGSLPGSRLTGILLGLREVFPQFEDSRVCMVDGNGQHEESRASVQRFLRGNENRRILVGAINDPSALGALQAFRDLGREKHCAIMGQNASSEAVLEMRKSSTRLIGSVGYFPEKYGQQVIRLAIAMIERREVSQAVFIKHQLITPANLAIYYPRLNKRRKGMTAF